MENGNIYNEKLNIFARRTLASGVKPIETMLTPVFEADFGDVAAYRMQLKINSVVAGVLGVAVRALGLDGKSRKEAAK